MTVGYSKQMSMRINKREQHVNKILLRDLYSASSRLLLRSAPDPCTAKKNSVSKAYQGGHKSSDQGLLVMCIIL